MFVSSLIFILKLMFRNKSFNLLSLIFIFILKLRFRNKSFNFDTFKKKLPLLIYIIIGENLKVLKATHSNLLIIMHNGIFLFYYPIKKVV